jgi:hypothetical protein
VVKRRTRRWLPAAGLALLTLLSGCLYPKDNTPGNNVPVHASVQSVQDAVKRYQESSGLLPLQNADASVPVYEKYKIDFGKLKRMGYLESIPRLAFENGGKYVFLIIEEETNPTVKLLDLPVYQGIADVQKKVDEYRRTHAGSVPAGEEAYPGFRYLDFKQLGIARPELLSMFSKRPLELLTDDQGAVYADYGIDIAEALRKDERPPAADEDLRGRLVILSDFVPVKSPVYRWIGDSPQAVAPSSNS